jgi:hypothetical protein
MLDALLDGGPLPGGDQDGLQPVADVLAALRAPAAPAELAGQASALAAFRAQPQRSARAARSPRSAARAGQARQRGRPRRGPLLRPWPAMVLAAGAAVLAGLAAGAYAGDLPGPMEQLAHTFGLTASRSKVQHHPHRHPRPAGPVVPPATPSRHHPPASAKPSPPPGAQHGQHDGTSHRPSGRDTHQRDGQQGGTGPGSPGGHGDSPSPGASATPTPSTSPAAQPSAVGRVPTPPGTRPTAVSLSG